MSATAVLFYVYALVAVAGAIGLVAARSLVHAVMSLFATLIAIAAIFLLLGSQFLAAAQLFVYGGAITVLVLFVLVFTRREPDSERPTSRTVQLIALTVSAAFFALLVVGFATERWNFVTSRTATASAVASLLFSRLTIPFEIAGLALTIALIGAVVLGREDDVQATSTPSRASAEANGATEAGPISMPPETGASE